MSRRRPQTIVCESLATLKHIVREVPVIAVLPHPAVSIERDGGRAPRAFGVMRLRERGLSERAEAMVAARLKGDL